MAAQNVITPVFQVSVVLLSEGKTGENPGRNAEVKADETLKCLN